jgi:hypothetical protein
VEWRSLSCTPIEAAAAACLQRAFGVSTSGNSLRERICDASTFQALVRYWKTPPLSDLAGLLVALLEVETRLRTVVPEDIHDVPHEAPKHPLQVLQMNVAIVRLASPSNNPSI